MSLQFLQRSRSCQHPCSLVKFTNNLRVAFEMLFFVKKLQSQTISREKLRKTLLFKKLLINIGEIDTFCQFHQHFTRPPFYKQLNYQFPCDKKLQTQTVSRENLCKTLLFKNLSVKC